MFDCGVISEKGPRPENEDSVGCWHPDESTVAMAVADGLGGHIGGSLASSLAVDMFSAAVAEVSQPVLPSIALAIHDAIRAQQATAPQLRGMATTLTGFIVNQSSTVPTAALMRYIHCGDTRIALQRGKGIKRLTQDHSEAQRLLAAGLLSRQEYAVYPRKNILESALGISTTPRVDYDEVQLMVGDRVFITSDGAHTKVMLREMREISEQSHSAREFTRRMCATIEERTPEDNFSVAALFFSSGLTG